MLFRFTLHAFLSTAAATAKLNRGKTKTIAQSRNGEQSSSVSSSNNHRSEAVGDVDESNYLSGFGFVANDIADDGTTTKFDFRDPFVPKKLAAKYSKYALNTKAEATLTNTVSDSQLQNQKDTSTELLLKNRSFYDGSKDDSTEANARQGPTPSDAIFDDSADLGILDSSRNIIHTEQQRELAEDFIRSECYGIRPKVNGIVNFQAMVKRCLYYKDNCPYNNTLPMGCWDTSDVTDMSYAFYNLKNFNEPLNTWETSSVTDMSDMFSFAASFDQPLDSWNLQSVTDSSDMFWGAKSFNQPLDSWNVESIQNFDYMFLDAVQFNQPLNSWKTAAATDMKYTFAFAESFNQPLNSWQTSAVSDMTSMFAFARSFDQPLDSWETQAVTSMRQMFMGAESFDQNVDSWETQSVTDMTYMFNTATSFSQCLSSLAYKNPTTITGPNIFNGTDCPVQGIPDVVSGPWCQGADDKCYPSSSGNTNRPYGLASAVLLGAVFVMPDILSSFFF